MRAALVAAAALVVAGLAAPDAGAHSLVRKRGDRIVYIARDATSLNALTVRIAGDALVLRDTAVEGGIDPGPCRPADISRRGWIVEVACPTLFIAGFDADLGDREDGASVTPPLPTTLRGGPGADALRGGGAFDVLLGGDGADRLAGGGGLDRIAGDAGDDMLAGEDGDDDLDGGLGRDVLDGGAGADAVHVRDGQADEVRCGAGEDRVEADTLDRADADCERVERVAVPPPPEPGPAGADQRSPRVRARAATRQPPGRVRILATASERGVLSASGYLDAGGLSFPVQGDRRRVTVGGAGVALRVRLGRRARRAALRALRRGRHATLRMGVVGTDRAGNSRLVPASPIRLRTPRARAAHPKPTGEGGMRPPEARGAPPKPTGDGGMRPPKARASHPEPGDVDGDGVGDSGDNCPFFRNADQADLDGDAAGDACEIDPDGDGAEARGGDNCRLAANPDQADADGNGFGDACDRDSDGDGVRDPVDSCPAVPDDQRADLDGDRRGDACDPDDDDDGVFDPRDRCPRAPDPLQGDRDLDGLGGACDLDEPPFRRWRPADGAWPADRRTPRLGVRAVPGRALRVTCSERCFVIVRLLRRGATVAQATAALAGPGATYVFLPARRGRAAIEASDPFGNAARARR